MRVRTRSVSDGIIARVRLSTGFFAVTLFENYVLIRSLPLAVPTQLAAVQQISYSRRALILINPATAGGSDLT